MAVTWRKLAYEDDVLLTTGATTGATVQAQTFTSGVIDSSLTASRLLASNGSKQLASVANLADWIAETTNQVTVTSDGDGSVTLALPQNIHTAATPTFAGVIAAYLRPAADGASALQLQTRAGNAVLTVNTTAQTIGIGASPATNAKLVLSSANTSTSAEYGLNASVTSTPAGAMNSSHRVLNFTQTVNGSGGGSGSALVIGGDLYMSQTAGTWSFAASVDTSIRLTNAGALTTAWGFGHEFRLSGAGSITTGRYFWAKAPSKSSTGVITTIQGFYASNLGLSGTTNSYAVYLENQTGSTNNYAIYTNGGLVRLGDTVVLANSTAPSTSPANVTQLYSADQDGTAGNAGLHVRSETGAVHSFGNYASVPGLIVNDGGESAATYDLRAESDTEANMLWLDASADLLYLGGSTNGVQIAKGGDLTLLGTAKYERHVQIAAELNGPPATQPTPVAVGTAGGLQFSSAVAQYAYCQWEIPDDWDGTDCYIEVDWLPDSGAISGTSAVRWTVEYRSIAEGETITNGTAVTVDNGAGGDTSDYSQYQTKHTRFTLAYNSANQPLTAQDHMYFKVGRDVAVTNDFTGTVVVTAFEVIYNSKGFPTSN